MESFYLFFSHTVSFELLFSLTLQFLTSLLLRPSFIHSYSYLPHPRILPHFPSPTSPLTPHNLSNTLSFFSHTRALSFLSSSHILTPHSHTVPHLHISPSLSSPRHSCRMRKDSQSQVISLQRAENRKSCSDSKTSSTNLSFVKD